MESLKTQNKSCVAEFTQGEKDLAARHKVEPKLVRLLDNIIEEKLTGQSNPEPKEAQSQQGHVGAPGESPKDNESEFQEQRFQNYVDEIQKAVSSYPVECRPELLTAALEQTTKAKEAAEKIIEIEQEIRRTCDTLLDPKAKATIALLSELSSLSGISNVGVDYATDILHSTYGQKQVKQAREQFPDDNNVAFLSHVFGLAHSVVKADDKIFLQEVAAEEETAIEESQPQPTEPEDMDTEDAEAGPDTGIKALDDFLESLSYEATAVAYGALRLVCVSDSTGKKMRDYLQRQVALIDDPKQEAMMDIQVLADIKWFLGFVRGAEIGLKEC